MLFNFSHQNPLHCNTKLIMVVKTKSKEWLAITAHQYGSSVLREAHLRTQQLQDNQILHQTAFEASMAQMKKLLHPSNEQYKL